MQIVPTDDDEGQVVPTLRTDRLLLRPLTLDDAEEMLEYTSDPEVARFSSWEPHYSIEATRAFLERVVRRTSRAEGLIWGIVHSDRGKLIGTIGLHVEPYHSRAELAYALARPYWGRGLATEAAREVIRFGFGQLDLQRIQATCLPENLASSSVMRKAGMSYEGTLREYYFVKGRHRDVEMHSILRREWRG